MKSYEIKIEWEIHDTRDLTGGFRTGNSTLVVESRSKIKAMDQAINFARYLPSWEFERNGIDLEQYRDGKYCRYYYVTFISKILSVKKVEK